MPGELIPIVIVPAFFLMVSWVIYVIVDGFRRRQQARIAAEFHTKLLDRIGSAQEFGEFLNTSGGAKFLDSLTIEREGGPHVRILRALQSGLVLFALGVGLFLLASNRDLPYANDGIVVFATIASSIGAGLLVSAGASYGLSKRLGLIDGESDRRSAASAHSA